MLNDLSIPPLRDSRSYSLLLQKLLRNSLKNLLEKHNSDYTLDVTGNIDFEKLRLTESERNTIRYVAGYIPYVLRNHLNG